MRKSVWIALALVLSIAVPASAYASPLDSFNAGLDTLLNPNTDVKVDDGIPTEYEPSEVDLYSPTREALPEDASVGDYINDTVDSFNRVQIGSSNLTLLRGIQYFLGNIAGSGPSVQFLVPAVGLVFVWWGVRKSKSIIWTAFRTGRLNLGTSVKRAWYRRKAKEWYG